MALESGSGPTVQAALKVQLSALAFGQVHESLANVILIAAEKLLQAVGFSMENAPQKNSLVATIKARQ